MSAEEIVERAAEVLFPVIHPHAARAIATGEGVAEYDQKHVRAAQALADAGLLPTEVEWAFRNQSRTLTSEVEWAVKNRVLRCRLVTPWTEVTS